MTKAIGSTSVEAERDRQLSYTATSSAPGAIGPYSQAVVSGSLVFCSGQIPVEPNSGELVGGGIGAQTARVLDNLEAVLVASGSSLDEVVKTTVYLRDLDDFEAMNVVYGERFGLHRPARVTVEVSRLPLDVRLEIECVARVNRAPGVG